MSDVYTVLLSWAISLSGFAPPTEEPIVVPKPHDFFVEQACDGQECKVYGWYAGGRNLYIDERLDPEENLLASSIVVHEMVHYLQGTSRNGGVPYGGAAFSESPNCDDAIEMERQAYNVQRQYLQRYGSIQPVGVSMMRVGCAP
ncbi:MAG: hypothetical protein H6953_14185 [Chromatiaceae bacterium]|nr:hypothetical protein [Gammaproteobacteria bacterium]MCP5306589.1 hypothetical protein [Chromatiaceae bacterium]MCP5312141.1 hypothetical protein [Chromatiaceae bacterium]